MPINLKSTADFWARIRGDAAASGDGTSNSAPARYDAWNQDIGSQDDPAAGSDTGTSTLIALIKRLLGTKIPAGLTVTNNKLLVDGSVTAVTPTISSYTTSGTPSTWTQALAANSSRKILFIQNLPTNTANIDVGFGGSGSEVLAMVLQPGDYVDAKNVPIGSRISCRSASASVPVIAWEA